MYKASLGQISDFRLAMTTYWHSLKKANKQTLSSDSLSICFVFLSLKKQANPRNFAFYLVPNKIYWEYPLRFLILEKIVTVYQVCSGHPMATAFLWWQPSEIAAKQSLHLSPCLPIEPYDLACFRQGFTLQAGLEFLILLSLPPTCWDYRHAPLWPLKWT